MSVQQPKKEMDAKGAAIARTTSVSKKKATGSQRDSRGADDEISAKISREDAIRAAVTAMRVTAMQKELDERGVNSNGVFERLDFIELLVKARLAAAALKDIEDAERLKAEANAREEEEEAALERMLDATYLAIKASAASSGRQAAPHALDEGVVVSSSSNTEMVGCGAIPETVGGNMAAVLSNTDQQEHTAEGGGDHTEVHSGWSVVNVNARGLDATLEEAERLWHDGRLQDTMNVLSALLEGSEELDNYRGDKGLLLTRIAILYEEIGDIAKALEYHFKHLELALKQSFSEGSKAQIRCYDNISFLYLKQGKDMLFRTYLEKAAETKREMLRVEAESRKPSRALSDAEEREKKQETHRQEAEMERKRDKREKAEREKEERLNVENEGLIELIDALKVPLKKRDESDVYKILCALDPIEYLQKRTNEHQRRELARLVKYETHVEAFDMYMPGDPADRAWIILGCTPFLEDYKGSVDVMEWDEAIKAEKVVGRVHYGNLFGEDALDGAERRKNHVVVSDDGHDDVITTNHFLTIMRNEFEEIINTYYHDCFQVYPGTEVLDCKYANLFDDGAGELSWFLVNSRNNILKSLDLQYNNIGPEGAHRIADLMANNYAITSIEMSNNHIGDLGVTGLCKALSSNTALISLSLRANQITNRSGPGLQGLLDMNTILTCVDLKENSICYAEAVAQLSEYAINHNYHVRYDHDNDLTLLNLAQSRERRAKEEAEYAKRSEASRGLSAASTYGSSSTVDGWTVRRKQYGQSEESYSREETEAVLKRIGLALRNSHVYQRRLNKDGPGVLRRECLVTDVSKRRTMAQPIFIETLWHFDIKVSADDAAVLAACFGYTAYVLEESLSSSRATTAASGARPRRTGAHTAASGRTREGSLTTGKQTGTTTLTPSTAQRRSGSRSEISRVLGTISSASSNTSEARNPNKILIVWPYVIQVLEGNCEKHIEEFGVFEKLDSDQFELTKMLRERVATGKLDDMYEIKEQLDRIKTAASEIQGF